MTASCYKSCNTAHSRIGLIHYISAPAVHCVNLWVPARRYRVVNKGKPVQHSRPPVTAFWWGSSGGGGEVVRRQTCGQLENGVRGSRGIVAADLPSGIDSSAYCDVKTSTSDLAGCDGVSRHRRRAQWINAANVFRAACPRESENGPSRRES